MKEIKPNKSVENRRPNGTFGAGNIANPNGRPKGKTIKERVREYLEKHPKDMSAFVKHFIKENRELAWQMLEGRPQQDVTSDGKPLPTPIYGGLSISGHNGDQKDIRIKEED